MKKFLAVILVVMVVALSACSSNATSAEQTVAQPATTTQAAASTAATTGLRTDYDGAVSIEMQLALGTLSLDGTANAITKDEAATLLPLWTSLQSLVKQNMPGQGGGMPGGNNGDQPPADSQNSSTPEANAQGTQAAPTVDATQMAENQAKVADLVGQIESAMTAAQLQAISAMQITQTSATQIMSDKGISTAAGQQGSNGSPAQPNGTAPAMSGDQSTPSAPMGTPDASQQPGGTQPAGGQQSGGNGPQMGQGQPGNGGGVEIRPEVVNAVIQYLANLAGVSVPTAQPTQS